MKISKENLEPNSLKALPNRKNIFDLFYSSLSLFPHWVREQQNMQQDNLQKFSEEVKSKIDEIPDDLLQPPKMNIFGPAIENSKYYYDNKYYREMFAKLIAASANKDFNDRIHPAFVDVITQLTPLEAQFLNHFFKERHGGIPYLTLYLKSEDIPKQSIFVKYVFNIPADLQIALLNNLFLSIENLIRLNIIRIRNNTYYKDIDTYYTPIRISEFYLAAIRGNPNKISDEMGVIEFTSFGRYFLETCMN